VRGGRKSRGRSGRVAAFALLLAGASLAACGIAPLSTDASTVGIALGWTPDRCRNASRDRDGDGVDDECELALARAFAPELIVDPRDCSYDPTARPERLGGGYLFAAQTTPDGRAIRIAYMPGYYRDCGWQGLRCVTRGPECAAHDGDSEIVVVETSYDRADARWMTDAIFLSAHCFGRSDGRCRWYASGALRHFSWAHDIYRGAPRIWVAKGKHANYPSSRECDTGHWYYDSCDGNSVVYRFPVLSNAQNVGSRRRPLSSRDDASTTGCIAAEHLLLRSSGTAFGTRECFWDDATPFRGWQRHPSGRAPASHSRVLRLAAGF
jgi:hypothetical protein